MKRLLFIVWAVISLPLMADDRTEVVDVMQSFYQWDMEGGAEIAKAIFSQSAKYNRVDQNKKHIAYSVDPTWTGKGKDAYKPYIVGLEIFGNMAIVRSLHHYDKRGAYTKVFILHKLVDGWQITNVSWGAITPES